MAEKSNDKKQPSAEAEKVDMATFDWVAFDREITGNAREQESPKARLQRKFAENPWVPIGAGVTGTVLMIGLLSFATKRTRLSQIMMRARVLAQGATMALLVGSVTIKALKDA